VHPSNVFLIGQLSLNTFLQSQEECFFEYSVHYLTAINTGMFRVPAARLQTVSCSNVRLRVVASRCAFLLFFTISSQYQNQVFILLGYEAASLKYWWSTFRVEYPTQNKSLLHLLLMFEVM